MATRRISHPLSDEIFSATKGDRTLSNLISVLGPPQMPMDFNVEDRLSHERWPVEKLFEGKSVYLENGLSTMVKRTHNPWVTKYIMPLKEYHSITFVWTKWHANRTLAPQTAVGAPPERVTQTRTQMRTTMNRYELGFIVNAETLDNPEGQFALALDIVNVGMAIGDTFEQSGLMALLQRKNHQRENLRKFHEPYGNAADIFAWEKKTWDGIRKDPKGRGFYFLSEEVKKAMKEIIPSDVIVPEGTKSLLSTGSANQDYYLFGDGARGNVELGADNIGKVVATGLRVHVVRELTIDTEGIRVAPLHRVRTIGDHARLDDYLTDCDPSEYRSCARTIKIFDMSESRGVFKPIDFMTALRATERFVDDGTTGKLVKRHADLAKNPRAFAHQVGVPFDEKTGFADMFLYQKNDGTYSPADVLGQMDEEGLPYLYIRKMAETVLAQLIKQVGNAVRNTVTLGTNIVNKMYAQELGNDDLIFLATSAAQPINEFGIHDLVAPAEDIEGGFVPAGYGNASGLYTIGSTNPSSPIGRAMGPELIAKAGEFMDSVDSIFKVFTPMLAGSHVAMTGAHIPDHATSSFAEGSPAQKSIHARVAFAQSFMDYSKPPLHIMDSSFASSGAAEYDFEKEIEGLQGVRDEELSVIAAVRAAIHSRAAVATSAVSSAFSDENSISAFRDAYTKSPFASAYARYISGRVSDASPELRTRARSNRSFELFAVTALKDAIDAGTVVSTKSIAGLLDGVVNAVSNGTPISTNAMESQLSQWAAAAPAMSRGSLAPQGGVRTALTVSPAALAKTGTTKFGIRNAHGEYIDLTNRHEVSHAETDSRNSITTLFAHAAVSPFKATATSVGNKRSRATYQTPTSGAAPDFNLNINGNPATANLLFKYGSIEATARLQSNWDEVSRRESDALMTLIMRLILLAPASLDSLERFYDNNIRVPVAIIAQRPLRRYETASCIFLAGGEQLGEIAWHKFDVHISSNAMTKDFEGNASIWMAPIIKREERYFILEDCLVTGYLGGESLEAFTSKSFIPTNLNKSSASVFFFCVPVGSLRGPEAVPRTHDIRGAFSQELIEGRLTSGARALHAGKAHYGSALFEQSRFNFNRMRTLGLDQSDYFRIDGRYDNTITHQTMQFMWNPKSGKWDDAILNTDHFGINIGEGHGDLRTMGASEHYQDYGYQGKYPPVD